MIAAFLSGLGLQGSLIVAIGPQNAFVLRQGLRREHAWAVAALCIAADVLLVGAGAGGVAAAVRARPGALALVTWLGAAAMAAYGARTLLRALRPGTLAAAAGAPLTREAALARAAAFTFLNPHVYLDAFLAIGAVAAAQPAGGTPWFVAGAWAASAAWFGGLALAARLLAPVLARPGAWRVIDLATGLVMCGVAVRLVTAGPSLALQLAHP